MLRKNLQAMKVLFCGQNFSGGYLYSKQAIEKRLAARNLDSKLISVIECNRDEVVDHITDSSVVVPWMSKITAPLMDTSPHLKLIMQFGVGLEGVDISSATQRNIFVSRINSVGCGNAQSCAEHCIYLATASLRNVNELNKSKKHGKLGWPVGRTLYASNTMIIGFGGIGRELLPRLLAMGAKNVTIVCRSIPTDAQDFVQDARVQFAEFSSLFHDKFLLNSNLIREKLPVDALFLCCTVNKENIGMVNETFLNHFQPGLHIINVSRGHLMNFDDTLVAMNRTDNLVAGVGTDVFHTEPFPLPIEHEPFLSHPKVISTPHVAGVTEVSYRNMAEVLADNVFRIFDGEVPQGVVNRELFISTEIK